jgi:hypothetical protein
LGTSGFIGDRRNPGRVRIDDAKDAFIADGADNAAGVGCVTQLQRRAVADRATAAVGIGAGEDQNSDARGIHRQRTRATAIG